MGMQAQGQRTEPPIIEVMIERSELATDKVVVFVHGERVDAHVVIVDPGQGWTRTQWDEHVRVTIDAPELSQACREAVSDAFQRNRNSEYIE